MGSIPSLPQGRGPEDWESYMADLMILLGLSRAKSISPYPPDPIEAIGKEIEGSLSSPIGSIDQDRDKERE